MRLHLLLVLSLLFLFLPALDADVPVGGYAPIRNIRDPHVVEIANFAVSEYNKRSRANLRLVTVVKGEIQVVAGLNYRLILAANDGSTTNNYQAIVWEKLWLHYRNLISFQPVH